MVGQKKPWNEDASPGGSSGGASSAAAAGFGPIHHGNDIAGSLRCPSFCCGLSTVKPTFGRVPAWLPSASAERGILSQMIRTRSYLQGSSRCTLATKLWHKLTLETHSGCLYPLKTGLKCLNQFDRVTTENYDYPIHPEIVESIERAADSYLMLAML
ncbi:MAG: hypothetical protein CM1200mP30_27760 [Pseudomonadota bacterium]|nr:MAG: hypothetical protein CM1200mP30_27760 [Pseudomonadota bacterium]